MICASCGTQNRPGRRFCRECGRPLALGCPSCGSPFEDGDRFCGVCGTALAGPGDGPGAPTTGRPATVAERRLVSVLFADMVGFTAISDDRDPEAIRELLGRYFELAREIVERYGGTIEKFIGDAVMAVWGTPRSNEDDAERAVRAALDLVDAAESLRATGMPRIELRAAVLTGEAAVSLGAQGQGMVAGDLVNTASRLQSAAPPGSVLVGEATVRAADQAIVFEPAGDQSLRGKPLPVAAWRAVRVVANRGGAGRTTRLEPPFVGRDEELRLLKDLFHAAARERRARLVSVTGIAGIGKSRLAWEFEKYADGLVEDVYWHQGRSPAYGDGLAFWALGEMVRRRAGIVEPDEPDPVRSKLDAMLADYVPDEAERTWVAPRLAALLGLESAPPGEREELYAAWRVLFERVSDRGPTVLVFEELQWADSGLLDFIESLLAWSRQRPILVLTIARPELLERRPTWATAGAGITSISLDALTLDEMEMLLVGLVPGLPQPAIRTIAERSEGIPLYAVETVRMLLDGGRLEESGGRYHLAGELGTLAVPDSLNALIGARVDSLPEDERAVLGHAAVLGQSFTLDALTAVAGDRPERLGEALGQLVRREFFAVDDDPRSPERGQHQWIQALAREVAYGRLTRRERKARHLAAADHFDSIADEERAGVVASHLVAAYEAAPDDPDARDLAERARAALLEGARRAASLGAHERALAYVEEAATLPADEEVLIDLRERAAIAAYEAAFPERAEPHARAVEAWRRATGDRIGLARIATVLTSILIHLGQPQDAVALADATLAEVGGLDDEPAVVRLGAELARARLTAGQPVEANETIDRVLPVAERLSLRPAIAELLASKGWAVAEQGRLQEGLALLRGAHHFCERYGFTIALFRCGMNLSAWGYADDPVESLGVALADRETALRLGYAGWAASLAGNAGDLAFVTGDWALWRTMMDEPTTEIERSILNFYAGGQRATLLAFQGELELAQRVSADADALVAGLPDPQIRSGRLLSTSLYHLARGEFSTAYGLAMEAAEVPTGGKEIEGLVRAGQAAVLARDPVGVADAVDRLANQPLRGHWIDTSRRTLEAGGLGLAGQGTEAAALYEEAAAEWRTRGVRFELVMCLLGRALVGPPGDGADAAAHEADGLLRDLGAISMLRWLPGTASAAAPAGPGPATHDQAAAQPSIPSP